MAVGAHDTGMNGLQRMRQCFVITSCSNPQKQAPVTPHRTPYPSAAALALLGAAVLSSVTSIAAEGLSVGKLRCCNQALLAVLLQQQQLCQCQAFVLFCIGLLCRSIKWLQPMKA